MRTMMIAALGAALLLGCDDDDDGSDEGARSDASVSDAGGGNIDAGVDAAIRDASSDASLDGGVTRASAVLASKSNSTVTGNAAFALRDGKVMLEVAISGATPGEHGIHIHQNGDCSAPNASSAGSHWNPAMRMHGPGDTDATHLGDLGNITVAADGKGQLEISKPGWTLGTGAATDVIGHAIVVHANEDDLVTQDGDAGPGNSGGRQACGVITALR